MKNLAAFEQPILNDGKFTAAVGVDQTNLKIEVSATYPIAKIIEPATAAVDSLLDKLEKAIPGDWDKPMIEGFKQQYKDELLKLLAE